MALNDNALLVVGAGNYFTAPVGTPAPADLSALDSIWESVGHTSIEDIIGFNAEGGEATVLGTLQNPAVRTSRTKRTESFDITIQQFDTDSLKLYYGANATLDVSGKWLSPKGTPTPTIKAFLAVYVDGENRFGLHALKSEILRGDNLEFADTESLAGLPLNITPVSHQGNDAYSVTPIGDVVEEPEGP